LRHVIVGNSAAGISAIEAIREYDKNSEVVIISDEAYQAYSRVFLPKYIAGEARFNDILMRGYTFYNDIGAKALLGQTVTEVIPKNNQVCLLSGEKISYDNLLIATGASPFLPKIPGIDKQGVKGFRTFEDACQIANFMKETDSIVIIGGGLVSLKAAEALSKGGVDVTVVVSSGNILSQRLDSVGASIIQKSMESKGIKLFLNCDVKVIKGYRSVQGVELTFGKSIECGIVIVAKGLRPNIGLVANTGMEIITGIKADCYQRTNIPNIFAAGDVAECYDLIEEKESLNQMWPNAVVQGRVAGANMAGGHVKSDGGIALNSGSFFGINIASVGKTKTKGNSYREVTTVSEDGNYRKIVIHEGRIVGTLLVGDISGIGMLHSLICQKKEVADFLTFLEMGQISFGHVLASLIGR